ncbi:MAG: hypothetical protein Q7R71_00395 [bacterium]|nr:hypothetical protein [bacterium]
MPPEPQAQDPQEKTTKQTPAPTLGQVDPVRGQTSNGVDIGKILLPKKEAPGMTTESAQRVSAGVLFDQETKAGVVGIQNPTEPPRASTLPAAKPPAEESSVKPLETYQADIEKVMQGSNTSIVSIAAAEAERRAQRGREEQIGAEPAVPFKERAIAFSKKFSMVLAGMALLAVAGGVIAYLALRPTTVPVAVAPTSPFIAVDDTQTVILALNKPRDAILTLDGARLGVNLSLGLVERLVPSIASTTEGGNTSVPLDAQTFLSTVAPNIPANFLRTIEPTYLLGVHVYDSNQPLLILRVDSYQEAFSGMLAWEFYMKNDLAPLFTYTPSPRIQTPPVTDAASTASTTPPTVSAEASFVQAVFKDNIVENHDTRVLQNDAGDIYLLWTFLDRNTLVITTNGATLREIISRLKEAPIMSVPAQ